MTAVRYKASYQGTGQLMRSLEMQELVRQAALGAMAYATGISPERTGGYRSSFEVEVSERGGPHKDRAEARLVNTSGHAVNVEWQDNFLVLTRTLGYLESG